MSQSGRHTIFSGLYGNALEWYDFMLYASFAPLFAKLYFPASTDFISLLLTFSVFSVSFFMRPFGGALLGHYADKVGRRKALIASITIMTIATALIAFLPGFHSLGLISPLLFVLLRLIQSVAIGGELPGTTTFLIEHTASHRRGLVGSLILSTAFLGIFLGSLMAALLSNVLTESNLMQWGWRLAYLLGALLGMIGIYMRIKSVETYAFLHGEKTDEIPAKLIFTIHKYKLLMSVIFTGILASGNYLLIAFITAFLLRSEHFLISDALIINFIGLLILTILIPCMGYLSDYFNIKRIFLSGVFLMLLLIFPAFWLLTRGIWSYALCGELLLVVTLAPINATLPTILAQLFPTAVRASGVSIGYNIGQAFFGGTLPVIALTLVEYTGNKLAPAWYIFALTCIVIVTARYLQVEPNTREAHQ